MVDPEALSNSPSLIDFYNRLNQDPKASKVIDTGLNEMGWMQYFIPPPSAVPSNPKLIYFPFAGRGECSRLIAAAGGVTLENVIAPDERKDLCAAHGCVGTGVPLLEHGDLKICQSQAIQDYL